MARVLSDTGRSRSLGLAQRHRLIGLGDRLGDAAEELSAALGQLRMAFVQVQAAVNAVQYAWLERRIARDHPRIGLGR